MMGSGIFQRKSPLPISCDLTREVGKPLLAPGSAAAALLHKHTDNLNDKEIINVKCIYRHSVY